jgi:hypothetical protein
MNSSQPTKAFYRKKNQKSDARRGVHQAGF